MERIIRTLKEMREKTERSFIEKSIIASTAEIVGLRPDTKPDLEMIIELNLAISILEDFKIKKASR